MSSDIKKIFMKPIIITKEQYDLLINCLPTYNLKELEERIIEAAIREAKANIVKRYNN